MGSLYRPTYNETDPETGERSTRRSDKWYADYRDSDGKRRRLPLSTDKAAAQAMLTDILRTVERQKAGLIDKAADQLDRTVEKSIEDYREHLESRGRSDTHISETIRHIRTLVNETGCVVLRDLQRAENSIDKYLASRRKSGKAHRTINADLTAVRAFCRWLMQKKTPER
jgi:site-specific recombinase XerD